MKHTHLTARARSMAAYPTVSITAELLLLRGRWSGIEDPAIWIATHLPANTMKTISEEVY